MSDSSTLARLFQYATPQVASCIIEFTGTFLFLVSIGCNVVQPNNTNAALAIGSTLMVVVFMGGHISGAHYNPAITLGIRLSGRGLITTTLAIVYVFVQLIGGFLGALLAYGITGHTFAPMPNLALENAEARAFFAEFFYTFALVFVVLCTATVKSKSGNSFFGLAIGFTVLAGAASVGSVSGGAFNPAVATGPTILHTIVTGATAQYLWVYWIAELLGGAVASIVFRFTNTKEYQDEALRITPNSNSETLVTSF